MAKFNAKENDPERYARVKEEQAKLQTRCKSELKEEQAKLQTRCKSELRLARLCPYCDYKLSIAIKGEHSWTSEKCPNCGEVVYFPPISFRKASNN